MNKPTSNLVDFVGKVAYVRDSDKQLIEKFSPIILKYGNQAQKAMLLDSKASLYNYENKRKAWEDFCREFHDPRITYAMPVNSITEQLLSKARDRLDSSIETLIDIMRQLSPEGYYFGACPDEIQLGYWERPLGAGSGNEYGEDLTPYVPDKNVDYGKGWGVV